MKREILKLCFVCCLLLHHFTYGQIDSLEKILPTLNGKQKFEVLGELTFQYCFVDTDKALIYGKQSLEIALKLGDSLSIAQAWNDLAAVYVSKGEFLTSIEYNEKALRIREKYGDSLSVASSLSKLGNAYHDLGIPEKSLNAYLRASRIYEKENKINYLSILYNNIGSVLLRQGYMDKAEEYLTKAELIATQINDVAGIINAKTNLANMVYTSGNYPEAQKKYHEIIEIIEKSGINKTLATVYMNLGASYVFDKKPNEGLSYYLKAEKIYTEKGDKKGMGMIKIDIGICLAELNKITEARKHFEEGEKLCIETQSDVQLYNAYEGMSKLEEKIGNYNKALHYYKLAQQHKQNINNQASAEKMAEMEVRYESEKKEKTIAVQEAELANKNLLFKQQEQKFYYSILIVLFVVTLIAFLFWRQKIINQQIKNKATIELQNERLRISRDLHDNIGSELTVITSALENTHENKDTGKIAGYVRNAMSQLRETVWAIRKEATTAEEFYAKICEYAQKICNTKNINFSPSINAENNLRLSPSQTIHLFRVCQESINNAVKHADCSVIKLAITSTPNQIEIFISDNGKGFDGELQHSGSYGLINMRERITELNGLFALSSNSNGTKINMSVPILS